MGSAGDSFFLLFLFLLVLGLAWLTTRLVGTRLGTSARGSSLRVLQHIPAGRDRSIMLLEAGGRVYLIGITGQQINLLDAIEDPDAIGRILEGAAAPPAGLPVALPFAAILNRALGRPAPQSPDPAQGLPAPPPGEGEHGRLRDQIERLRRLQNK